MMHNVCVGRDSPVGIATRYGLDGLGHRIPVEARFSGPKQTGSEAQPTSCRIGNASSRGQRGWSVVLTTSVSYYRRGRLWLELYIYPSLYACCGLQRHSFTFYCLCCLKH